MAWLADLGEKDLGGLDAQATGLSASITKDGCWAINNIHSSM